MQSDTSDLRPSLDSAGEDYSVCAGTIIGAHGVQGAVKIKLATGTALSLIKPSAVSGVSGTKVWIGRTAKPDGVSPDGMPLDGQNAQHGATHTIRQVKELQPGGRVLLMKLSGTDDRNAAEALVGLGVYAPKSRRAALMEGEYFTEDLIGIAVTAETGRRLGKIVSVLQHPASDVYETDLGALIPAVRAVVKSVDLTERRMLVVDLPGLLPDEADELRGDEPSASARDIE